MNTWMMFIEMNKSTMFDYQHLLCYSHISGASSEVKQNFWVIKCALNVLNDFFSLKVNRNGLIFFDK